MKSNNSISAAELRAGISLALVFFLRMLALFMLLPVIALMANKIAGATPVKIGLALGIYGLTQALFQIPFGMLSDKWGRKPIITMGLIIFATGSVIAAMAGSIDLLIIGRALQGAGAIAATVMALAADLTREEQRTKIMAIIGISIGFAFSLAFIIGPLLYVGIGYTGLFLLCALLAMIAIAVLYSIVPNPQAISRHRDAELVVDNFREVIRNSSLNRLHFSIFASHVILMANFTVLPLILRDRIQLETVIHWHFYLPVLFVSVLFAGPMLIFGERFGKSRPILISTIILFIASQFGMAWYFSSSTALFCLMTLFFIAFNYMEAYLPSQVSRSAPATSKGTALGIYTTSQFIGIFIGGIVGGVLHEIFGLSAVYLGCALLALLWLPLILTMAPLARHSSVMLNVGDLDSENADKLVKKLCAVTGVIDAVIIAEEGIAYLKVNSDILDHEALNLFSSFEQSR